MFKVNSTIAQVQDKCNPIKMFFIKWYAISKIFGICTDKYIKIYKITKIVNKKNARRNFLKPVPHSVN